MNAVFTATEKACSLVAITAASGSSYMQSASLNVYTGTDNDDKAAPAIICWAESASEDYPFGGIWHVKTNIIVKEMANESSPDTVSTLLGDIQSAFLTQSIESNLNSKLPYYYVYQVVYDSNDSTTDGDAWVHTLGLDIVCTIK